MKINIGTTNNCKVEAVKEVMAITKGFEKSELTPIKVDSGIDDQPKSLEETITGAQNRAKAAFSNCDYSIGLESGLMKVPEAKTGYMDGCVCVIYDGEKFHMGLSSFFECPIEVTRLMIEDGLDMSQAVNKIKLTEDPNIGSGQGAIGILTKGKMTRKNYTKQCIITALIHIENKELY